MSSGLNMLSQDLTKNFLLQLFYYWNKTVTDRSGRSAKNAGFIGIIRLKTQSMLIKINKKSSIHTRNNQVITGRYTSEITQIPIGLLRQTDIPCLRPAVSSLGACPMPAR